MRIFIHSWRQVMGNLSIAMQISWPVLAVLLVGAFLPQDEFVPNIEAGTSAAGFGATVFFIAFAALFIYITVTIAVAIAWHRFVLLGISPGQGLVRNAPIWGYFWRSIVIGLIAALPVAIVQSVVLSVVGAAAGMLSVIIVLVFSVVAITLAVRLSLVLPALAIGKSMTLGESWGRTAPVWGDILIAMLCVIAIQSVSLVLRQIGFPAGVPLQIIGALLDWVITLLSLSVLTTLYGHLVEGRALNA